MLLALHHDKPSSSPTFDNLRRENLVEKLKALDSRVRRKGLDSIDAARNPLIDIGMEIDADGRVTKNSYGVFNLCWQAEQHPEWAGMIDSEVAGLRNRIRKTHSVSLRYVIWAGMGGSAEDKSMYNALGLLRRGARVYVLDSTDPVKLHAILEDIENRSGQGLSAALKSTLVVGMAMGMTSYEPVVNLEKLAALYEKHQIDSGPNFIYMTLPNSLLDKFGRKRGYRRVELQPDDANSTAGRHSSPLTRGSLYPLGLCGVDLNEWIENSLLTPAEIETALQLASFLYTQAISGRNKITLLLPKAWAGAGLWTKQDFEESLGKREDFGLKIVIGERPKLANYRPPKDPAQDRCFLAVLINRLPHGDEQKIAALRRAGYPIATLKLAAPDLSRYMQLMHYSVFGIAWLARMNFVTQPGVELYKAITNRLYAEAEKAGGIEQTREWRAMQASARRIRWRNGLALSYDRLPECVKCDGADAAGIYAGIVHSLLGARRLEYGELTFFGDTRYSESGRAVRKVLDRGGEQVFRRTLRTPVDIYEGPAMNHSYHEMIIGHGRCFSTVLLNEGTAELVQAGYSSDYHRAQFLATQMALAERGRHVVGITVRDLSATSLRGLEEFFTEVAKRLKACGAGR